MSSLSVSHYQSLDSHERKSIMLSHKLNLVIIIFSLNSDVQIETRTLFFPPQTSGSAQDQTLPSTNKG